MIGAIGAVAIAGTAGYLDLRSGEAQPITEVAASAPAYPLPTPITLSPWLTPQHASSRDFQRPPLPSATATVHSPAHVHPKAMQHDPSPTSTWTAPHHTRRPHHPGRFWFGSSETLSHYSSQQRANAKLGYELATKAGWDTEQVACLDKLWDRESSWQVHDPNPTSSADGIPQALPASKMAKFGEDWRNNPTTQIRWGMWYITGRYATACAAWQHSQNYNWY